MKFKKLPFDRAFTLGLALLASPSIWAAESSHSQPGVGHPRLKLEFTLRSHADVLTQKAQENVLQALSATMSEGSTVESLPKALAQAQQVLDQIAPASFIVSLPEQTLDHTAKVEVLVTPVLREVSINGLAEEDAQKLRASLPAGLQPGALLNADNWPSAAVLSMFNDHPLRLTTINYKIERDRPVTAEVNVQAPLGNHFTSVTVDNYGNDTIGRGLMSATHIRSGLFGFNDTLSLAALTSLNSSAQASLGALRYSVTDHARLTQHAVGLFHSQSNVNAPFFSIGRLEGKGSYDEISYRQTRYLNGGSSALKNVKFFAEVAWSKADSDTQIFSQTISRSSVTTLPLSAGLEALVQPASDPQNWIKDSFASLKGQMILIEPGIAGLSNAAAFGKARLGADRSAALRLSVDGQSTLGQQWRLKLALAAQYSQNKLLPAGQMSIAGGRSGVRGFVNAVATGDTAVVMRLDVEPLALNYTDRGYALQPYGFYDAGHKRGGNDERVLTLSSVGLGWRLAPLQSKGWFLDAYAAKKLKGASQDLLPGFAGVVDETTYWLSANYRF